MPELVVVVIQEDGTSPTLLFHHLYFQALIQQEFLAFPWQCVII